MRYLEETMLADVYLTAMFGPFQVKLTELPGLPPLFKSSPTSVQELLLASMSSSWLCF